MPPPQTTEIRGTRISILLGYLIAFLMKMWSLTLRYHVDSQRRLAPPQLPAQPIIFALWHNRIFTMPPIWQRTGGKNRKTVVLTSASKDGTILATTMKIFGLGSIRGSSSRRAVTALIGMKKALLSGFDVCITPDGPRGPRYQVQPGLLKIAQLTGCPIIPIHLRYSAAWRLSSWDRFVLPMPFSRVSVSFGPPVEIPRDLDETQLETARLALSASLTAGCDDL